MKNQLKRSRILNGVLAGALALVVVGSTAVVGAVSNGFQDWGRLSAPEQVQTDGAEEMKSGFELSNVKENGVRLMSASIPQTEYENYGVSPLAESAITLTATVTPANATNQKINWGVRWKDSTDIWASTQTVTDYVTVQAIGDKQATISCLQAFNAQIEVVATAEDDALKTATCTVDYVKKIESLTHINLENAEERDDIYFTWTGQDEGVYCTREILNDHLLIWDREVSWETDYTLGTKDSPIYYWDKITFVPTEDVVEAITDDTDIVLKQDQEYEVLALGNYLINCIETVQGGELQLNQEGVPESYDGLDDVLYNQLCRLGASEIGELRFYVKSGERVYYEAIPVLFNAEDWRVDVTAVSLNMTGIDF